LSVASPTSVTFEVIGDVERFASLAEEWDELVRAMPRPSPFMLHGWLDEWLRHYGDEAEPVVHVARRNGHLSAALPLVRRRRFGSTVLAFAGEPHSALADLLVRAGEDESLAHELVARVGTGDHDYADLFGLPTPSRLSQIVGPSLRLVERVEAPVLDLERPWSEVYNEKTSSKKRNLHKRRRRQLQEQGSRLEVVRAQTVDELLPALDEAFRLHELRWSGRPDGSGFATPQGKRFNRAAVARLAPLGAPRIVLLKLDGRAIAFHYYFALEGAMYVYRLAFDPALSRFSPGQVNTLDAIEAGADEGLTRVEFLGGDERYKLELADRLEPLHQGLGLARTPQGRVAVAARMGNIRLRRRLKRSQFLHKLYFERLAPVRRTVSRVRRPTADA
jgi:CelD/BcsL family acetyltransferase involved in cellulose biosynthesis